MLSREPEEIISEAERYAIKLYAKQCQCGA